MLDALGPVRLQRQRSQAFALRAPEETKPWPVSKRRSRRRASAWTRLPIRCRAIWSLPIDSAGTDVSSSSARWSRSEWICWKTSSEVQLPLTPPSEHMFVLYRNYVRCQAFRDVNLPNLIPDYQARHIRIQAHPTPPSMLVSPHPAYSLREQADLPAR